MAGQCIIEENGGLVTGPENTAEKGRARLDAVKLLTVHLLDPVLIVVRQFIILGYPLVPWIHESALHGAVRQTQRVAEFVSRHGEQTSACNNR